MMPREIEIRFSACEADLSRLKRLGGFVGFTAGRPATRQFKTVYYDTPDFALKQAGLSLRVRKSGRSLVQTVKDIGAGGLLSDRQECACVIGSPTPNLYSIPDEALRARVITLVAGAALEPAIESEFRRTTRILTSTSVDIVEIALDRGEIRTLKRRHEPIAIAGIEVELKQGTTAALYRVARELSRRAPLALDGESKWGRGMRLIRGEEITAHKAGRMEMALDCTAEEAFSATLKHCVRHLARNIAAIVEARLPEGVHQMRVGLRRLRAALAGFGDGFRGPPMASLREQAKLLAGILGNTRELDVFTGEMLQPIEMASRNAGFRALRNVLEEQRRESWQGAASLAASDKFTGFMLDLEAALDARIWREGATPEQRVEFLRPARDLAMDSLNKWLKSAGKRARHLSGLSIEERHRLRLALKRLRYSAEFFAPLFPPGPVTGFLDSLSRLQDLFGALNDAATAGHVLRRAIDRASGDNTALVLGAASFVEGWHQSRVDHTWEKAKKRWKRFVKTEPFWRETVS